MSKERELLQKVLTKLNSYYYEGNVTIKNEIEELLAQPESKQEPVAWMYDWEEFYGDETEISYGRVTTDKNIFDCPCAMNITPLIKGVDDEQKD
jgi:hypothetical protein